MLVSRMDCIVLSPLSHRSTLIGERGVLLSGGQRARLQLARAVYADADLYILDDPLSACDAIVGKSLFQKCIKEFLLDPESHGFTGRTSPPAIMLITHQIQFIKPCDNVCILHQGRILSQGSFLDAVNSNKSSDIHNEFVQSMRQFLSKAASIESIKPRKSAESVSSENAVVASDDVKGEPDVGDVDIMGAPELASAEGEVSWNTYTSFFSSVISAPVFCVLLFLMVCPILLISS